MAVGHVYVVRCEQDKYFVGINQLEDSFTFFSHDDPFKCQYKPVDLIKWVDGDEELVILTYQSLIANFGVENVGMQQQIYTIYEARRRKRCRSELSCMDDGAFMTKRRSHA
eukprot:352181_1